MSSKQSLQIRIANRKIQILLCCLTMTTIQGINGEAVSAANSAASNVSTRNRPARNLSSPNEVARNAQASVSIDLTELACIKRVDVLCAVKNFQGALQEITAAINLQPASGALHAKRANIFGELCLYDKCIADCDISLRLEPNNFDAFLCRASAYYFEKKFDLAAADAGHCVQIRKNDPRPFNLMANIHEQLSLECRSKARELQALSLQAAKPTIPRQNNLSRSRLTASSPKPTTN